MILLVAGLGLLVVVFAKRLRVMAVAAVVAGLLLGGWRGGIEQQALQTYIPYQGQALMVSGYVSEDASFGAKGDQRLHLKNVRLAGKGLPGELWVSTPSKQEVKRGDVVYVEGKLSEGFGSLAAVLFRARLVRVERPHPGDVARVVRDWFADGVRAAVSEPQASLGIGYLTGQRSALPASLDEQLRIVGLTHAVVASGYNLTILVAFARKAFSKISKYLSALSAGAMILSFMLITGFSPSMSRAGLVAGLSLVAWYFGRKIHPLVLLPFAAAVTILLHPSYVWGDIGWYLSFAAFSGIILLAPLLLAYFWGRDPPGQIAQLLVETVAAFLITLPIILCAFGQFPTYAVVANMLVLPLVPLAMLLTFGAGVVGLIVPGMAQSAGFPGQIVLSYMTRTIEQIANLPNAQIALRFGVLELVSSYAILSMLSIYMWRRTGLRFRAGESDI